MRNKLAYLLILWFPIVVVGQSNTFPTSGNVGIGNTSPNTYLQLGTTNAYRVFYALSNNITPRYYQLGTISDNNGDFRVSGILAGHTDGQGKATIDIKFSVRDGFKALGNVNGEVGSAADIVVFDNSQNNKYVVYLKLDDYALTNIQLETSSGGVVTYNNTYSEIDPSSSYGVPVFALKNDAGQLLRVDNSGNLGIGTNTPDSKLTVAGKVHAQEVKVTITAGADFVFEESYQPPTLKELESFIKSNKHLPEIASASQMETEGLELGAMNIKLLQKIEELTLYTIDQQKLIEEQFIELKKQSKSIKEQSKAIMELQRNKI